MEGTLSLDGTAPNAMTSDLDLNSNSILNARNLNCDVIIAGGQTLVPDSVVAIDTAASVPNVAAGNIVGTDVQAALDELDTEKLKIIPTPVTGDLVLQAADGELSKAGYGLPNVNADINASDEEINYSVGVTSLIQTQLDSKEPIVSFRGCLVYLDANQSIADVTYTELAFDQESYDTDSIHDNVTNNTRLTVPSGVTKVKLIGKFTFTGNSTGLRVFRLYKNGNAAFLGYCHDLKDPLLAEEITFNFSSPVINVTATDYFDLVAYQNSGGALNVRGDTNGQFTWFAMEIIE